MTLTLTGITKSGKGAIYAGLAKPITLPVALFEGTPDATIEVSGGFKPAPAPKVKLTKEERQAQKANAPKPTLAEKIAAQEAKIEKLRKKMADEAAAAAAAAAAEAAE